MTPNSKFQIPTSKRQDLAAIVFIAALVLLFFWRIITPRLDDRAAFPPGDFTDQFWMFRQYAARAFAEGRLPLWSDNFNSGHPFLADVQSAIFYPISLVWTLVVVAQRGGNFTLLDLEIEAIFHFILVGAFTYLFAKRLLGSRFAALVSAITFTFSGYLTAYPPQQLAILETATWLPLILLFLDLAISADMGRGLTRMNADEENHLRSSQFVRVPIYYVGAGVALGIAALAGHPQTFLFVGYASVIFFAWRAASHTSQVESLRSRITFYVLRLGLVGFIVLGIAAAQFVPTLEYTTVSTRAAISWAEASGGFPTLDPLQMILPGYVSAFQAPLYIGILPLWLALFALFVNRSREKSFWILLALGSLIVSFGAYVFAYALFYLFVPGFAMFRGQERLAFVISFALAILVGYGVRDLMQSSLDQKLARRAWALLPAGVVVSALMLFTMYIAARQYQTGRFFFLTDRAAFMTWLFVLASVLVGGLSSLSPVLRGRVGWGLIVAFIAFDLFTINNVAYNAESKERYPITPIIQTIQADHDIFRVVDEGTQPGHFGIADNLEEIGGISPLRIARYNYLLDNLPEEKLWALLNVRYVTTERPGFPNAEVVANEGKKNLLRLNNSMPRAWLVGSAQTTDDQTALDAMKSDSFNPQAIAYIADALPFPIAPNAAFTSISFTQREPEHEVMSFNTPTDSLLIISEPYYPGWRATVDGTPTPILRADVALRAIPVRAGAHIVELIYDPWSVKIGIGITIATLLIVFVATMIGFRRK